MKKRTAFLWINLVCLSAGVLAQTAGIFLTSAAFGNIAPSPADSVLPVFQGSTTGTRPLSFTSLLASNSPVAGQKAVQLTLGYSRQNRPIAAYYIPGKTDKRALIIGGVHGSELASIEVVKKVVEDLRSGVEPYYSVVVIPCLFPDNAATAAAQKKEIGSTKNIGRYTHAAAADPNRQMPPMGSAFNEAHPFDFEGRLIENENQLLLQLIEAFRPQRIVNVHAIRNIAKAGIFADPRTDCKGLALGYRSDSLLAIAMAQHIAAQGGNVAGNALDSMANALYHNDPEIAPAGQLQKRNLRGSLLNKNLGSGVSLGTWASTAVCDTVQLHKSRNPMRVITVEFPGNKRPADYTEAEKKEHEKQVQLYASAISQVFLNNHSTEDEL